MSTTIFKRSLSVVALVIGFAILRLKKSCNFLELLNRVRRHNISW
jgi:hypothetical protein